MTVRACAWYVRRQSVGVPTDSWFQKVVVLITMARSTVLVDSGMARRSTIAAGCIVGVGACVAYRQMDGDPNTIPEFRCRVEDVTPSPAHTGHGEEGIDLQSARDLLQHFAWQLVRDRRLQCLLRLGHLALTLGLGRGGYQARGVLGCHADRRRVDTRAATHRDGCFPIKRGVSKRPFGL